MDTPETTASPPSRSKDLELAARAIAGDPEAFVAIVRGHNRLLFRTARGIVPDADAQDVVQETYLRAFRRLDSYRGEAALGTWLARMAINVALTMRRQQGRVELAADLGHDDESWPDRLAASDDERPDVQAGGRELRALLQVTIDELPPIYRSVFILRAIEEMSVADTAYCLGVSEDVVKTRFLRARALLRERLASRVENGARDTFGFAGARCDAVLAHVMAGLRSLGLLRADRGASN